MLPVDSAPVLPGGVPPKGKALPLDVPAAATR
jgi:hypothetical protein